MIISRLALANLKKKKSASIIFLIFILLAAALLDTGLTLISRVESCYRQKEEELNGAQFIAMSSANTYKKEFEDFVFHDARVALAEKEEVIFMPATKNNRNSLEFAAVIFNRGHSREIAPLVPLGEDQTVPPEKAIYVPVMLKAYNISTGDDYEITYKGEKYSFTVAGFFETNYYGSIMEGCLKYYMPDEGYQRLYSEIGRATILSARFKETDEGSEAVSEAFTQEFIDTTDYKSVSDGSLLTCQSAASLETRYMMFIGIIAVILIAFALVVGIIIMAVIYNRVTESIEESMQNIGILQALGYTAKEIMTSLVLEFFMLSILGSILGILFSYASGPILSVYLRSSGMIWRSGIHVSTDLICFTVILFIIGLTAFLGAIRILRLPPVKALTKSAINSQADKNIFPLHKGAGSVHFRLGLKNLLYNKKSNVSFILIVAGGIFAIGLSIIMYLNFALDNSVLMEACGFEMSDFQIAVTEHTDAGQFATELLQMDEIRKTNLSALTNAKLENQDIQVIVSDNFDAMEVLSTYEGELPRYDNEIAITGVMSKKFHKKIGDTVKVTADGRTQDYYVTGIYQTSNNSGYMSVLPLSGMKRLRPRYEIQQIDIYLEEGVNKEQFKEKLRTIYKVAVKEDALTESDPAIMPEDKKYTEAAKRAEEKISKLLSDYGVNSVSYAVMQNGEIILSGDSSAYKIKELSDLEDYLDGQLSAFGSIASGMVTVIAAVTFLIIGGILSITIKSRIRAKRTEYGIYKAMGYTTKDLVFQFSLSFTVTSFLGIITGSIATLFLSGHVLGLLLLSLGLTRISLKINPASILLMDCCMMVFICLFAIIKAYRIRKITAYELMAE